MKVDGPPPKAYVIVSGDRVTFITPYTPGFQEEIKGIPSRWRVYDQSLRTWTIREPYVEEAIAEANKWFRLVFLMESNDEQWL